MIPHGPSPLDHTQGVTNRSPWARLIPVGITLASLLNACSNIDDVTLTETSSGTDSPPSSTQASVASTTAPPTTSPPTTAPPSTESTTTTEAIVERVIPETKADLIAALTEAEQAIRNPQVDNASASQWGQRQQRLYRVLAENPDWGPDVIAGVSDDVGYGVQQNWAARQALSSLVKSTKLAETLPAWQLREPLPVDELMGYYREAETQTGIPWNYLAAINLVETRMGRIEGFSTAGATGPMQFLPSTWAGCCEGDPTVDRDAIIGAGVYLVLVGGSDDIQAALFRYNNSDRYVDAITAYAEVMAEDELAYRGYHAWQVYFLSAAGLIRMPADYYEPDPVPVDEWLEQHPEALLVPAG